MSYSFKITGSFYQLLVGQGIWDIQVQKGLTIDTVHIMDEKPYVIVTFEDEDRGKRVEQQLDIQPLNILLS